jgi:hypothetical protein
LGLEKREDVELWSSFILIHIHQMQYLFLATFNNISVILCQSVLLVEETGAPEGNHQPAASH